MVSRILRPQTLENLRPNRCIENSDLRKTETAKKLGAWNSCPTAIPQFGFVGDDLASRTFHYLNPPNQRENLIPVNAFYCDKNQYRNFIQNQHKYKINLSHLFFTIFFFISFRIQKNFYYYVYSITLLLVLVIPRHYIKCYSKYYNET